jgi:hypothetical protein
MKASRIFEIATALVIVAGLVCGQQARAQDSHHSQVRVVPHTDGGSGGAPAPDLYALQANFGPVSVSPPAPTPIAPRSAIPRFPSPLAG